jgi:hypothetical protein
VVVVVVALVEHQEESVGVELGILEVLLVQQIQAAAVVVAEEPMAVMVVLVL